MIQLDPRHNQLNLVNVKVIRFVYGAVHPEIGLPQEFEVAGGLQLFDAGIFQPPQCQPAFAAIDPDERLISPRNDHNRFGRIHPLQLAQHVVDSFKGQRRPVLRQINARQGKKRPRGENYIPIANNQVKAALNSCFGLSVFPCLIEQIAHHGVSQPGIGNGVFLPFVELDQNLAFLNGLGQFPGSVEDKNLRDGIHERDEG